MDNTAPQQNDPWSGLAVPIDQYQSPQQSQTNVPHDPWAGQAIPIDQYNQTYKEPGVFEKIGNAAKEAALDTTVAPLAHLGAMVYGSSNPNSEANKLFGYAPVIESDKGSTWENAKATAGNVAQLVTPFIAPDAAEGQEAAIAPSDLSPGLPPIQSPTEQAFFPSESEITGGKEPTYPKSAGEINQDQKIQQFEEDVRQGHKGDEAKGIANDFDINRGRTINQQLESLGNVRPGGDPADHIKNIANIIRDEEPAAKQDVTAKYEAAKESAKDAGITRENVGQILPDKEENGDVIFSLPDGRAVELSKELTPNAYKRYQALKDLTEGGENDPEWLNDKTELLPEMEKWRRLTTTDANTTGNQTEALGLRTLRDVYDQHMSNLADSLEDNGSGAVQNFKDAIAARKQYGNRFERNQNVENIVEGKNIDDVTRQIIGSGSLKGKNGILDTYNATLKAAGDRAPEVQKSWRDALAQKMYNKAQQGMLPNTQEPSFSTKALQSELTNLFVNQRELATSVYGEDTVAQARRAIAELKTINASQPGVKNLSNSGNMVTRVTMQALKSNPKTNFIMRLFDQGKNFIQEGKNAAAAADTFKGKVPKEFEK